MSSPIKPTIVLIHGAWHAPSHFSTLAAALNHASYPTSTGQLPSVNASAPKSITAATDVDFARTTLLLPLLDDGKDIIVVCHSYGGLVACAAAAGLSKGTRRGQGKDGGVIGIVCIAAFLGSEGAVVETMIGGTFDPRVAIDKEAGQTTAADPVSMFYGDIAPAIANIASAQLKKHAFSSFTTPFPAPVWAEPWMEGRRAYVKTTIDSILPVQAQQMMLLGTGVSWKVKEMNTAHSPFLGEHVKPLVRILVEFFEGFEKLT